MASKIAVIPPAANVHSEAARFERDFDQTRVPDETRFEIAGNVIDGERANPDWSRLGLTFGALFALGIAGIILVWIPVVNILWILVMLAAVIMLPILGARAAVFRLRKGRKKTCRLEFSDGPPRPPTWESDDDVFWKPVREFFELE
ncbi:MAG: hypothetical protein GY946_14570 [bacterium]|nr:hypothetical protein [bacterium]